MTAAEIDETLRIDENPRLTARVNLVTLSQGIDLHRVGHAGTAALLDKEAQAPLGGGKVFFLEQVEEVLGSGFGDFDHLRGGNIVPTIPPGRRCPK